MKDCKYRLPCNWCDRLNKYCDMVEPIKIELPDTNNCDHDWILEYSTLFPSDDWIPYYKNKYVCGKCHESKIEKIKYPT